MLAFNVDTEWTAMEKRISEYSEKYDKNRDGYITIDEMDMEDQAFFLKIIRECIQAGELWKARDWVHYLFPDPVPRTDYTPSIQYPKPASNSSSK